MYPFDLIISNMEFYLDEKFKTRELMFLVLYKHVLLL